MKNETKNLKTILTSVTTKPENFQAMKVLIQQNDETKNLILTEPHEVILVHNYLQRKQNNADLYYQPVLKTTPYLRMVMCETPYMRQIQYEKKIIQKHELFKGAKRCLNIEHSNQMPVR